MPKITFKPKQITKKLLSVLPTRARDVVAKRYGLESESKAHTLESIGQVYGITRERVRQIENHALQNVQKSSAYRDLEESFVELKSVIDGLGSVIAEDELLEELARDEDLRNHLYFLLVVGEPFNRVREDDHFKHRWHTAVDTARGVENALKRVHKRVSEDDLISENELIKHMYEALEAEKVKQRDEEVIRRWLSLSNILGRNPLGEWGVATSPNVRAKGIRDFAYLAVKRHGSPMHFKEVADSIERLFGRKAHVATCHNELIKDKRFVLVGRGLYALSEWGYTAGVVKDVLREILEKHGPLTREEIIDRVKKERYVKENTIIVNLQDPAFFKKTSEGTYVLAE